MMVAEIFGMDGIVVLIVVMVVLFGSSHLPKLARSVGSAKVEFEKGINEGKQGTEAAPEENS